MILKLQLGYRLGFEIATFKLKTLWGLLKWAVSPKWWNSTWNEPGFTYASFQFFRLLFTLGTLVGYMAAQLAIALSPRFTLRVGLGVDMEAPLTPPLPQAAPKHELIH